jgi:hypothetical protein
MLGRRVRLFSTSTLLKPARDGMLKHVAAVSAWFRIPEQGMKSYEILCASDTPTPLGFELTALFTQLAPRPRQSGPPSATMST